MTDFWATFLFIPSIFIFVYVGLDGYFNGNTILLTAPYDGAGNFCGVGNFTGYDYLVFQFEGMDDAWAPPSPKVVFKKTVCAKECPQSLEEGEHFTSKVECKTNDFVRECPNKKYLSTPMMNICVPKTGNDIPPALNYYRDTIERIYVFDQINMFFNDL